MKSPGPIFAWSRCVGLANGCQRRSRTFAPHVEWMCGRCYRSAPKHLRDRRTRINRQKGATRSPARKQRLQDIAEILLDRIFDIVRRAPEGEAMPPLVVEQLRRDGLL